VAGGAWRILGHRDVGSASGLPALAPSLALALVRQKDGTAEKWKLPGETWQLVEDAGKFNRYVEDEVVKFLPGAK
jgi:hypothetical protein